MGVTVHFSGRLRSPADAPRVVEEVLDIAETLGWPHEIIDSEDTGILVQPHPQCEGLLLLFDVRGTLRNPVMGSDRFFCKTQFAPIAVHVALVKLLRHLGRRWFAELAIVDEGGYWESGDLEELERRRRAVGLALDQTERMVRSAEGGGDLASRIERILQEHQGRPIELTPDESDSWSVERWIEHLRRCDDEKHPLLKEMRGRPETAPELRDAIRRAHEEQEKEGEAPLKALAQLQEPEEPARPDPQDDPALKLGHEFLKQFMDQAEGIDHPVVEYVVSLVLAATAGVYVAAGVRELEARRLLAVERFQAIARLLRAFPDARLEALASGADNVARAFSAG